MCHYHNLLMQEQGYYAKLRTAFLEENNYNVLFLGSSRVEMHYDPRLFDSITGFNSFNLGLAGASPQQAYAALCGYLKNSAAPEHLFYEVDYHSLKRNDEIKDFNNYFPVLRNPTLRHQFSRIDPRMDHFYYNPFFSWPFTGFKNLSTGIHNCLRIPNRNDSLYYKGFVKEVLRPDLNYISAKPYFSFFELTNRQYLDSIILLCKKKRTNITLISSPVFAGGKTELLNKEQITAQIADIAKQNNILYYDLSSLPFCNGREFFVDHYHMNYRGATIFTRQLAVLVNNKVKKISLK